MAKPKLAYETRIILFLDFLGFKEIVERTDTDASYLHNLLDAVDLLHELGRDDAKVAKSLRVTTFSDSIVLSYAVDEESAVFYLLTHVAFAIIDLAIKGFVVRGAVTFGKLIHTDKYLVGPAMVRAFELESKVAKYPRILVDPKLVSVARKAHAWHHTGDHEAEHVRDFLTKDSDGETFIDYISWRGVVDVAGMDDENYPLYLRDVGKIIAAGLTKTDAGILSKYLWMHQQYVRTIHKFERLGKKNEYRLNNPEICDAVVGLPKMLDEAAAARKIIKEAEDEAAKRKSDIAS
jgi:hypothetical protein